jgi:hypothetical protein
VEVYTSRLVEVKYFKLSQTGWKYILPPSLRQFDIFMGSLLN